MEGVYKSPGRPDGIIRRVLRSNGGWSSWFEETPQGRSVKIRHEPSRLTIYAGQSPGRSPSLSIAVDPPPPKGARPERPPKAKRWERPDPKEKPVQIAGETCRWELPNPLAYHFADGYCKAADGLVLIHASGGGPTSPIFTLKATRLTRTPAPVSVLADYSAYVPAEGLSRLTAEEAVAPVVNAIRSALAADAALPPPTSVRQVLERLGKLDQAGRQHIHEISFGRLGRDDGAKARELIAAAMEPVDEANLAKLKKIIPAEGWFTREGFGVAASEAAFHIVQHADLAMQKEVLSRLLPLAERGEIEGFDYAAMFDRIATSEGRPQRYGTQFHCVDGKLAAYPLEDAANVDTLRRRFGFEQTFAESARMHVGEACAVREPRP